MRRMAQRSATHTIRRGANGDVSVLLIHSDPDDKAPADIARGFKYVLCYGRKWGSEAENTATDSEGRRPPGRREVRGQCAMREALNHRSRPPNYNQGRAHGRGGESPTSGGDLGVSEK